MNFLGTLLQICQREHFNLTLVIAQLRTVFAHVLQPKMDVTS